MYLGLSCFVFELGGILSFWYGCFFILFGWDGSILLFWGVGWGMWFVCLVLVDWFSSCLFCIMWCICCEWLIGCWLGFYWGWGFWFWRLVGICVGIVWCIYGWLLGWYWLMCCWWWWFLLGSWFVGWESCWRFDGCSLFGCEWLRWCLFWGKVGDLLLVFFLCGCKGIVMVNVNCLCLLVVGCCGLVVGGCMVYVGEV